MELNAPLLCVKTEIPKDDILQKTKVIQAEECSTSDDIDEGILGKNTVY
jgi:hypothetical protein